MPQSRCWNVTQDALDDGTVFFIGDGRYGLNRLGVREGVLLGGAGCTGRMRMDDMGEGEFPVRRTWSAKKIGPHFVSVGECCRTQPHLRMRLGQQHEGTHTLQFIADLLPVPGGGMGCVEQLAMVHFDRRKFSQRPGKIVRTGTKETMPTLRSGVFRRLAH